MKSLIKFGLAAFAAMSFASSAGAATCQWVAAVGDGPSKDIATIMSTHGLANIIENKGLKGQGPVKTHCEAGTILTECHSSQKACK